MLWLHDCLAIWRSVYFLGHISTVAIILVGMAMPPRKAKKDGIKPSAEAVADGAIVDGGAAAAVPGAAVPGVAENGQEQKKEL